MRWSESKNIWVRRALSIFVIPLAILMLVVGFFVGCIIDFVLILVENTKEAWGSFREIFRFWVTGG